MKAVAPTRSILLLMGIGFLDLVTTALLHAQGQIVEMNPLMRPLLDRNEWLFVAVKGASLLVTWFVLVSYARQNLPFVRKACLAGSAAYAGLWLAWFTFGR